MNIKILFIMSIMTLFVTSCSGLVQNNSWTVSGLSVENFRKTVEGKQTDLFVLANDNGMEVCITNFGARIVSIMVPDREGNLHDVVLGFDSIQDYLSYPTDFGAVIGRYANRINRGKIQIGGCEVQLPCNNYGHCLHGGPKGWQYKVFEANQIDKKNLELKLFSPDGDNNFPGNVTACVFYTLTNDNAIQINYKAVTDKKTIINLTNHSYFNLSGNPLNDIMEDLLYINARSFTPIDSTFMTTGEIKSVINTCMDFTVPKVIGHNMSVGDSQIKHANGYDHNWVLDSKGVIDVLAAKLVNPESGIALEVYTSEPGIQVYTGNFLDGSLKGKKGLDYGFRSAICLETQHYPDSPNKSGWPNVYLEPGEVYTSQCIYKFTVE